MDANDIFKAIDDLDLDWVRSLLSKGKVSPNVKIANRYEPIFECLLPECFHGDSSEEDTKRCKILKVLVQHGGDVNAQLKVESWDGAYYDVRASYYMEGFTPAIFAARRGYLECLRFLSQAGADLNLVTESKLTALLMAVQEKRANCVEFLIQHVSPATLNQVDSIGETALMYAAQSCEASSLLCMRYLLNAGASLQLQNESGNTALIVAVDHKNIEAVRLLVDSGAEVSVIRHDGETPLTRALDNSKPDIVTNLLMSGADPTYSYKGLDRFHENVAVGRDAVVRALVSHGFPPLDLHVMMFQDDDDDGDLDYLEELPISPLAVALLFHKPDIARYFIENRFFTRFDILQLGWNSQIRRILQRLKITECLEILDTLSMGPQSLLTLSFVAIANVLTEDLVRLCLDVYSKTGGRETWLFRPTFKERVNRLDLPLPLKKALLREK